MALQLIEERKKQNGEDQWFGLADATDLQTMPLNADEETEQTKKAATDYINAAFKNGVLGVNEQETLLARHSGYLGEHQVLVEMPIEIYSYLMNMSFHAGAVRGLLLIEPEPAFAHFLPL